MPEASGSSGAASSGLGPIVGTMTTQDTTHSVVVDRIHTGPEGRWEQAASRAHAAVPGCWGWRPRGRGPAARLPTGGGRFGGVGWLSSARRT